MNNKFLPNEEADVEVIDVHKSFKEIKAVNGIDIKINGGEFVALLGPNGAGKTTLVEMIEGIQKPDSGQIIIRGMNWRDNSTGIRKILGISLQETYFIDKLTVYETLKLFASFYGLDKLRIEYILELVNLGMKRKSFVVNLSGGQRQRLALGIALLNNAQILLLDEPTTGLDPTSRREIWDILIKLKNEKNTSLILTSHYMEEAEYLCDRIIVMDKGKILAEGTLDELLSENNASEIIEFELNGEVHNLSVPGNNGMIDFKWDPGKQHGILHVKSIAGYIPEFIDSLRRQNLSLENLESRKMTLDDLFIKMTGRSLDQ